ncbi:desulfoferrodoxin family protein [Candidatus Margulisiibacteriota bacterium]
MKLYICKVCGHIEYNEAPANCPVCGAPKTSFTQNDNVFKEAEEKSKEAAVKHIPAVTVNKKCGLVPEQSCTDVIVRIGKTLHPMEEAHFIKFIDCYIDNKYISRVYLSPAVNPAACFHLKTTGKKVQLIEFCNKHGHWQTETNLD